MSSELKTLKDLIWKRQPTMNGDLEIIKVNELKAEVVKWLDIVKTDEGDNDEWAEDQLNKWIIHFFNLTDEDLK